MTEVETVASNGPTGFATVTGFAAIKAEQLREKTAAKQMERILLDLTKDNLESSANKLNALMHGSQDLLMKGARIIVHSQKPVLEKQTPAQMKERAERRGALLATLISKILPKAGEDFRQMILDECLAECHMTSPPPKFTVSSMIGELHTPLKIVDDNYIHECTAIMLKVERRSHVQAITMMLGRCTPDWKHKQRLVFPHGHYDELKRQARTMGKPTYMGVKSLAERTRPSWMDRQEEARERRAAGKKAKALRNQANNSNWQHRRQPHQNWAQNALANNQRFEEKAPSVASSGSGRGRSRRNRSRNRRSRAQSPVVRAPSPALSCRTDATLPVTTPIPQPSPKAATNAETKASTRTRDSAFSVLAALNRMPSIRNMQEAPVGQPDFEPAPMPGKPKLDDELSIAQTDITEMGSAAGAEPMRLDAPTRGPWHESNEEQKKKASSKPAKGSRKKKASNASTKKGKKSRANRRGKRGGKANKNKAVSTRN